VSENSPLDRADDEILALHAVLQSSRIVVQYFARGSDAGYDKLKLAIQRYDELVGARLSSNCD